MDLLADIKGLIVASILKLLPTIDERHLANVAVELPKSDGHGDFSSNAALVCCKPLSMRPLELAKKIADHISAHELIHGVEVAPPGFINIKLAKRFWAALLSSIKGRGKTYGYLSERDRDAFSDKSYHIEFLSANPTGPVHIGHVRGGIFGDVLSKLLRINGFEVVKEYYINDAGSQITKLARTVFLRYKELFGESVEIEDYPAKYLIDVANALKLAYADSLFVMEDSAREELIKRFTVDYIMETIKADLKTLGIEYDVFFSEELDVRDKGLIEEALSKLEEDNLLYYGVLAPPKGGDSDQEGPDWDSKEQLLFRSTKFGDDTDRVVTRSNGETTYLGADIGYQYSKILRGYKNLVMVLGADHKGYISRISAIVQALGGHLRMPIVQTVNFMNNGQRLKMSKRSGDFISIKDVLEHIDKDSIRFLILSRKNDTHMDFDLAEAASKSKDNPVFYVQYANARVESIFRNAHEAGIINSKVLDYTKEDIEQAVNSLVYKQDIKLLKTMAQWPRIVRTTCETFELHKIIYYMIELADIFHSYWSDGKSDENLRFIIPENKELTMARLILLSSFRNVMHSAMQIIDVKPVDSM